MLVATSGSVRVELWTVETTMVSKVVNDRSTSVLEVSYTVDIKVDEAVTVMVLAGKVVEMVEVVCGTPATEQAACKIFKVRKTALRNCRLSGQSITCSGHRVFES